MNADLDRLQPYPFEKLAQLKAGLQPPVGLRPISLAIGEPRHAPPEFVLEALTEHRQSLAVYPATKGLPELRLAIADWLTQRFKLAEVDAEHQVLPVNGTREALFAVAQALVNRQSNRKAVVAMPNPFYQIYEGAALLAGAEPLYINCSANTHWQPDFDAVTADQWQACQLLYLCSPGNPTGAVIPAEQLRRLLQLAAEHDFIIASDECYSEIYPATQTAPIGLLQAAAQMGNHAYERCLVFHSLSKRSNLPGLRSGFVAGDAKLIQTFLRYRTYHGCAMSVTVQHASIAAWRDEQHVQRNRERYQEKFEQSLPVLQQRFDVQLPDASFYYWLNTGMDDLEFCRLAWTQAHVNLVPGQFLARQAGGTNPGKGFVRLSMVASTEDCLDACERLLKL